MEQDGDDDSPMSNYPRSDAPSIDCQNFSIESRIVLYSKHRDQLDSWKYSEEERASLRHKVESLSREQGILHCILGHMLHLPDEMIGTRTDIPESDEARHALLALARGSHWSVMDLAHLFYFAEKLNMEACEKSFRGIPLLPSSHQVSKDYRRRIETHFARCLLED